MDKWQGTVEVMEIRLDQSEPPSRLDFLDREEDLMFSILPHKDNALHVCAMAGQCFVLDELGWDEYDEVCRRMKGSKIVIDLSGMRFG